MTFNSFEYNECGVCINPDIPYRSDKGPEYFYKIEVSETRGGWVYGYEWNVSLAGGGCSPASFRKCLPTKTEAIVAAAERLKRQFVCCGAHKAAAELEHIIESETAPASKSRQLTIFDYL